VHVLLDSRLMCWSVRQVNDVIDAVDQNEDGVVDRAELAVYSNHLGMHLSAHAALISLCAERCT
jgi:hypothetical protein